MTEYTTRKQLSNFAKAGGCMAAIIDIVGYMFMAHDCYTKQNRQNIEGKAIKGEQQFHTNGILVCLKGLKEQVCNSSVSEAINK